MIKENHLDVDKKQLNILKAIIKQHISDKTAWVYGSRATWKASETSDLDLAVFDCTDSQTYDLKEALEESDLLFSVDVMNWEKIPENFRTNIKKKYVVLQEKKELEDWREVKLGEVIKIIGGGTPKTSMAEYWGGDIPWLAPPDFVGANRWVEKTKKSITQLGLNHSSTKILHKGDVIISARGTVGALAQIKKPMAFSQSNYGLRAKRNSIESYFLFYITKSCINNIKKFAYGTVFDTITSRTFEEVKISLPPLPEQKVIAEILSSLDDKIDLLHRQNKTLESIAQTLFRQWFIEEAQDDWEIGSLGDIIENFDSKRIPVSKMKRDKMKEGKMYPYYGAAQIMDYVSGYIFDGEYILMAEDGTVKTDAGYPVLQYAKGKFWANNHTHVLKAKIPYNNSFIWHFLLKLNIENIITGAVQPKINQGNLNSIPFPKYPLSLVNKFQEQVKPMFKKTLSNQSQINTLENLRDTLLPKLMSGKVRVSNNG